LPPEAKVRIRPGRRLALGAMALSAVLGLAPPDGGRIAWIPAFLRALGSVDTPGRALGISTSGSFAFVADDLGLQVIDISDPRLPRSWEAWPLEPRRERRGVRPRGLRGGLRCGLVAIDVSNPASPAILGSFDTPGVAEHVATTGSMVLVADGDAGIQVIDVSDPAHPTLAGTVNTPGYASAVAVSGSVAFVADGLPGLQVIDVSNPAAPVPMGNLDTPGYAVGVAVSGSVAYVADYDAGLQVIDVSNPAAPGPIGTWTRRISPNGLRFRVHRVSGRSLGRTPASTCPIRYPRGSWGVSPLGARPGMWRVRRGGLRRGCGVRSGGRRPVQSDLPGNPGPREHPGSCL